MRTLSWIITLPIAVIAVLFSVSNRGAITFSLWPTSLTLEAPLYLAILSAVVGGFLAGGLITWMSQGRFRRRARDYADRIFYLERDLKDAEARAADAEKRLSDSTGIPAGVVAPATGSTASAPSVH